MRAIEKAFLPMASACILSPGQACLPEASLSTMRGGRASLGRLRLPEDKVHTWAGSAFQGPARLAQQQSHACIHRRVLLKWQLC